MKAASIDGPFGLLAACPIINIEMSYCGVHTSEVDSAILQLPYVNKQMDYDYWANKMLAYPQCFNDGVHQAP